MGYYYTAEPENAVPPKSWATPKTHVPGSPVKERGYRFYMPESGKWASRDPVEEDGYALYVFADNNPESCIDYLGANTIWIKDKLPETTVYSIIKGIGVDAGGRVTPEFRNSANCECIIKTLPQVWIAKVTLTLSLTTEIVGKGVKYNGVVRTKKGIANTKSHEANHRASMTAEFNKYKGYYGPVLSEAWATWGECIVAVKPIEKKVNEEWPVFKIAESKHEGDLWDKWFEANGKDPIW